MNFQICGRRTGLTSTRALLPRDYKIWGIQQRVYQTKAQDASDFMQCLTDVWAGVEQSVIDDVIDQRRRHLHACFRTIGGHVEYSVIQICQYV